MYGNNVEITLNDKKELVFNKSLPKAVKLNNAFVDRLVSGSALSEEMKEKIKAARIEINENKSFGVVKPEKSK